MERIAARRLLARPRTVGATFPSAQRRPLVAQLRYSSSHPTVFSIDFWRNLVPKPMRRSESSGELQRPKKSKEWNPATFYIVIFLFIGSMSINQIAIRTESSAFMQQADTKIRLLREVVEKLQKGEEVDVEEVLKTGDPVAEEEWEGMLKELQDENAMRNSRKKYQARPNEEPQKNIPPPSATSPASTTAKTKQVSRGDFY